MVNWDLKGQRSMMENMLDVPTHQMTWTEKGSSTISSFIALLAMISRWGEIAVLVDFGNGLIWNKCMRPVEIIHPLLISLSGLGLHFSLPQPISTQYLTIEMGLSQPRCYSQHLNPQLKSTHFFSDISPAFFWKRWRWIMGFVCYWKVSEGDGNNMQMGREMKMEAGDRRWRWLRERSVLFSLERCRYGGRDEEICLDMKALFSEEPEVQDSL